MHVLYDFCIFICFSCGANSSFRLNILGSVVPLAMFRYLSPVLVSDKTRSTIHVARESHCKEEQGNMAPLWELCADGKLDEVRSALARGEDVNDKDSNGNTALMLSVSGKLGEAVSESHNSIVKLLLDQPGVSQLNCASH